MTWWRHSRVPVTFLAGYLGSGKTTLVNRLLASSGRRLAVLVNDVGSVNIDAALIRAADGDTIELTDGCVCCSLTSGLGPALETLRERDEATDHVVVELSGVAEPSRVTAWASTPGFRYDAVITLADPDIVDRSTDPRLTDLVGAQLSAADLVVTTKHDLVADGALAEIETWLGDRVDAPVVGPASSLDPDVVLGPAGTGRNHERRASGDAAGGPIHETELWRPGAITQDLLDAHLDGLGDDVVRVKGVVEVDGGRVLVQRVGRRLDLRPTDLAPTGLVEITIG